MQMQTNPGEQWVCRLLTVRVIEALGTLAAFARNAVLAFVASTSQRSDHAVAEKQGAAAGPPGGSLWCERRGVFMPQTVVPS